MIALIATAVFAVAREGLETVFFLLAVFSKVKVRRADRCPARPDPGGDRRFPDLQRQHAPESVGILQVDRIVLSSWSPAGILANSVQALHEAGLWNHLQTVLFDFSATLPMDGPLPGAGRHVRAPGMLTVGTLGAYLIYLLLALVMFFMPARRARRRQPLPVSSQ